MPGYKMSTRNLKAIRRAREREPKLVEGPKQLLVLKGPTSSQIVNDVMKDLRQIKAPDVKGLSRKNDIRPFEEASSLEFLCDKNECAAFLYGSHSKKRPHNVVLGRMFDRHVLDMLELGIVGYEPIDEIEGPKKMVGSSPLMVFNGDEWERSLELTRLRGMLLDIFGARDMKGVALAGVDHVIQLTVVNGVVHWRVFFVHLKKSASKVPRVELQPMGPSIDFVVRRTHAPSSDLEKAAMRQPKALDAKKEKNVSTNMFGETLGRLHMERQDFSKLNQRKGRAAKADRKRKAGDALGEDGEEGAADADVEMAGTGSSGSAAAASAPAPAPAAAAAQTEEDEYPSRKAVRKAKKARVAAKAGVGSSSEFDA